MVIKNSEMNKQMKSKKRKHNSDFDNDLDTDIYLENLDEILNQNSHESEESSSEFEDYEKVPRFKSSSKVRNLLPIKTKDGLVFRSEELREDEEKQITSQAQDNKNEKQQCPKSLVENYVLEQQNIENLKGKVAVLCTTIIEDPQNNMKLLKELIIMLQNQDTKMIITEKSILLLSLLHLFSDILPSYKIRLQDPKESKIKLKKETKILIYYEQSLLRYYKKYVDYLQTMIKNMKSKKILAKMSPLNKKAYREIGLCATKCMCELLATRLNFNYLKNIGSILVGLVANRDMEVTNICCDAFMRLFKADKLGEASLEIIKQIVKILKERKFCVPPILLKTFLSLNIKEASFDKTPKKDMKKVRQELSKMSRKERQHQKKMKKLEIELRETESSENIENIKKFHTEIISKIFWVYFHVLKDDDKKALITPVLEGLSKFAHLINLEFFDDLNSVLCGLMESGNLSDIEKLHCVHTLFTILSGQAELLHIDPHKIYCHMYQMLMRLSESSDYEQLSLSLNCLDSMVLRRKKKISINRILAFMKRISIISLQTPLHGTIALLSFLRCLLLNVKSSDILLDSESIRGSGIYHPDLEDPEHSNAQSAILWELLLLRKHYNPVIEMFSSHILHGCPNQGRLCLPDKISRLPPIETLNLFKDVVVENKMELFEDMDTPPKKKFKFGSTFNSCFEECETDITWENVKNIDFLQGI